MSRETRLKDAARMLPALGAGVLLLPDLLLADPDIASGATARWIVYFFAAWAVLIAVAFWLGRVAARGIDER